MSNHNQSLRVGLVFTLLSVFQVISFIFQLLTKSFSWRICHMLLYIGLKSVLNEPYVGVTVGVLGVGNVLFLKFCLWAGWGVGDRICLGCHSAFVHNMHLVCPDIAV